MKGLHFLKQDIKTYLPPLFLSLLFFIVFKIIWNEICPLVILTGFPCPGCGCTRAFFSVLRLDFKAALDYNACIYLFIIICIYFSIFRYILGKKVPYIKQLVILFITILILYFIYRMATEFTMHPELHNHKVHSPMYYKTDNYLYKYFFKKIG